MVSGEFTMVRLSTWLLRTADCLFINSQQWAGIAFHLLQWVNKSAQKTCLLGMDDWQIGPLEPTIVPWMADKSAKLIVHARNEWLINRPRNYKPWKDENFCLSIISLLHKSGNCVSWFSTLIVLYIHLPCTVDRGGATILSLRNVSTKEESPCQTVNMGKNCVPGEGM